MYSAVGYLIYYAFVGVLLLAIKLEPKSRPFFVARLMGWLLRSRLRRSVLLKMECVFGNAAWSSEKRESVWQEHLRHIGLAVLDPLQLSRIGEEQIQNHVSIEGEEHLRAALEAGRGALLFLNHLGSFTAGPYLLARRGYHITLARTTARVWKSAARRLYGTAGIKVVYVGELTPSRASEIFHGNGLLAAFFDYAGAGKHTAWFDFGPAEIRQHLGPAILALRHRVPALYLSSRRVGENRHHIRIDVLECENTGILREQAMALTRQATALLYQDVRERPEQWWMWDWAPIRPRQQTEEPALSSNPTENRKNE